MEGVVSILWLCRAGKAETWIYFCFKTTSGSEMLLVLSDRKQECGCCPGAEQVKGFRVCWVWAWLRVWKIVGLRRLCLASWKQTFLSWFPFTSGSSACNDFCYDPGFFVLRVSIGSCSIKWLVKSAYVEQAEKGKRTQLDALTSVMLKSKKSIRVLWGKMFPANTDLGT